MDPEIRREMRDELGREIAGLEDRLAKLRRFASEWDELFGGNGTSKVMDIHSSRDRGRPVPSATQQRLDMNRGMTRYERIRAILAREGGTLTIAEIIDRLMEGGDGIGTDRSKFYNVVESAMRGGRRKGWFVKEEDSKATWSLTEKKT